MIARYSFAGECSSGSVYKSPCFTENLLLVIVNSVNFDRILLLVGLCSKFAQL